MSYNLGSFNQNGQIGEDQAADAAAEVAGEPVAEVAVDEAAPAAEEDEANDADGDGHDDETGEFVEGNQEAAAPPAAPVGDEA
jgi:hypothetical protein